MLICKKEQIFHNWKICSFCLNLQFLQYLHSVNKISSTSEKLPALTHPHSQIHDLKDHRHRSQFEKQ